MAGGAVLDLGDRRVSRVVAVLAVCMALGGRTSLCTVAPFAARKALACAMRLVALATFAVTAAGLDWRYILMASGTESLSVHVEAVRLVALLASYLVAVERAFRRCLPVAGHAARAGGHSSSTGSVDGVAATAIPSTVCCWMIRVDPGVAFGAGVVDPLQWIVCLMALCADDAGVAFVRAVSCLLLLVAVRACLGSGPLLPVQCRGADRRVGAVANQACIALCCVLLGMLGVLLLMARHTGLALKPLVRMRGVAALTLLLGMNDDSGSVPLLLVMAFEAAPDHSALVTRRREVVAGNAWRRPLDLHRVVERGFAFLVALLAALGEL